MVATWVSYILIDAHPHHVSSSSQFLSFGQSGHNPLMLDQRHGHVLEQVSPVLRISTEPTPAKSVPHLIML